MHPRVLAIVGLTGTGKSDLACAVARETGAEIVSADSVQVYRHMDIGTAKPSTAVRAQVPHHLIDVVDPDEPMSAGAYLVRARSAAWKIHRRGRPIILCGGTGLYARAFAGGLLPGAESDSGLRARLEARSTPDLRRELERRDPTSAGRIHVNDRVRIMRALEVLELSGELHSRGHAEHAFKDRPFDVRWVALDLEREVLWDRLRERVDRMFQDGLVDEVRRLHAMGYGSELRSLCSIGYREVGFMLAGRMTESEARDAIFLATRRYAKRQRTWFRGEPGVTWVDADRSRDALKMSIEILGGGASSYEAV
jgi:tRNA dimethylallyltransferase